ncbi:MAG: hypothetical protein QNK04_08315 [Myxococcota bacterium]|nr:hypothetical protein [Myxococcota bacterium]
MGASLSPRAARWLLFGVALLTVPLPMLQFGANIPVARYLLLAGVTGGLVVTEGTGTIPLVLFGLFVGHALVYGGLLWVGAWLLTRLVAAAAPRALTPLVALVALGALLVTSLFDVYTTPFAARSRHTNLLHVIE